MRSRLGRAGRTVVIMVLLLAPGYLAQVYTPGPQVLTFFSDIDDSDQPYALYVPKSFDPAKKYPLVISLHGEESNHRLNLRRVFGRGNLPRESDSEASRYFPPFRDVGFIVACPLARGSMGYQGVPEKDVYDMLADVKRRFPIDEDRVYLTGISMGGGGALWLALTRPDLWAAVAPVCAAVPPGAEVLAPNALNLSVHLFHGDQDPLVPVASSRQWHKRFLDLGVHSEYVEYPGARHNAWDYAYRNSAIFEWFARFKRDRFPERVCFASRAYRYRSAYWVELDGLTPGALASIDAKFAGPNRIEVKTENLDGFTLKTSGHPRFLPAAPAIVTVDGSVIRRRASEMLSFSKIQKGWKAERYEPAPGDKRPGLEGPMSEAVAARHIYVYGTADSPPAGELKQRRDQATFASEWSNPRARLSLSLAVKADREVTPKDLEDANLVLFGTKETNGLVARFTNSFPVELNASAADYGLAFVAPVGKHYAVVNSGLAWWTGADQTRRLVWRDSPAAYRVLVSFGDYILFKGSLEHVVAEGLFDRHWKLPAEAAAKMKATGAVVIR